MTLNRRSALIIAFIRGVFQPLAVFSHYSLHPQPISRNRPEHHARHSNAFPQRRLLRGHGWESCFPFIANYICYC